MTRAVIPAGDSRIVAAMHRTGQTWRIVTARRTNSHLQLMESRSFAANERQMIETWLDQQQVGRIIVVLPASKVVCRTVTLPNADEEQLQAAVSLQAETHLLGTAPPHRMAGAVLHHAPGESTRAGLLLAWPEKVEGPDLPLHREVTYTADVAGIAALLNGARVDEPLLWADPSDGSIAFALCHAGGVVFRAARESAAETSLWTSGISRLLAETAINANHTEDFTEMLVEGASMWLSRQPRDEGRLLLNAQVQDAASQRLEGAAASDAEWWANFGVAAGALIATLDQLNALTTMQKEQPIETPTAFDRVAGKLSTRHAATRWILTAVLVVAFAPLVFAGMRVMMLQLRVGSLDEIRAQVEENERQFEIYEQLAQHTWPMGKLLADIANAAPEGVTFEQVSLDEDSGEFDVRGEGQTDALVLKFRENLVDTGIFSDVTVNYNKRDTSSSAYKITVSGSVKNAFQDADVDPAEDFAYLPLGKRIYGERFPWDFVPASTEQATNDEANGDESIVPVDTEGDEGLNATSNGNTSDTSIEPDPSRVASAGDGSEGDPVDPLVQGRTGPRGKPNIPVVAQGGGDEEPKGPDIPDPYTKDQIVKMNKRELLTALGKVGRARRQPGLSDEQKQQLTEQYELLKSQLSSASDS